MHHYVKDLSSYVEEYTYRFNRRWMQTAIFDDLLIRAEQHPLAPYAMMAMGN